MLPSVMLTFRTIIIPALFLMLLLPSCTTLELPDYPAQSFDRFPLSLTKAGLTVAVQPLTDVEEQNKYFGTDLVSNGILPVFVVAHNQSSFSFLLQKDSFSLGSKKPLADSTSDREKFGSETGAKTVGLIGAVLIALPLQFLAGKMGSDATVIKQNFLIKELQTKTLSSGKTAQGFVYFKLHNEPIAQDQWHIHLKSSELQSKQTHTFDYSFQWDRRSVQ